MKLSIIGVVALLAVAPAIAPAQAQANAAATSTANQDKALDTRIEKRISSNASLKKYDIKVDVNSGVATLSGTVATDADRTKAGELAKIAGITRVDNRIVVDLDAATHGVKGTAGKIGEKTEKAAEKTKDAAVKAGEKTKDAAVKAGEKTKEGLSKTGEVITDGWITTRVKSKFIGEDLLKDSDINVDTNDHVVTLSGTVTSQAGRARAVAEAKEVEGVRRVVDKLKVAAKK